MNQIKPAGSSSGPFALLMKKLGNVRRNIPLLWNKFYDIMMMCLYYGGLQASILYGIYTKPPLLMQFWYSMTGNEAELMKLQQSMYS